MRDPDACARLNAKPGYVIASAAKQSTFVKADWIAASLRSSQ
jgi:hypothetical protein